MRRWRVWVATVLLIAGVGFVAATAETGAVWWSVCGSAMLLFVPALIVDEARRSR